MTEREAKEKSDEVKKSSINEFLDITLEEAIYDYSFNYINRFGNEKTMNPVLDMLLTEMSANYIQGRHACGNLYFQRSKCLNKLLSVIDNIKKNQIFQDLSELKLKQIIESCKNYRQNRPTLPRLMMYFIWKDDNGYQSDLLDYVNCEDETLMFNAYKMR